MSYLQANLKSVKKGRNLTLKHKTVITNILKIPIYYNPWEIVDPHHFTYIVNFSDFPCTISTCSPTSKCSISNYLTSVGNLEMN